MIFCKRIIQELASSPYLVNELTIVFFVSNDFKERAGFHQNYCSNAISIASRISPAFAESLLSIKQPILVAMKT